MQWLLDKRAKSVAVSAQRVVADMHRDLDLQRKKVSELEALVAGLTDLCTESLENEIFRLELKRKELLLELQSTDEAIHDRQRRLEAAKDGVRGLLMQSDQGNHVAEEIVSTGGGNILGGDVSTTSRVSPGSPTSTKNSSESKSIQRPDRSNVSANGYTVSVPLLTQTPSNGNIYHAANVGASTLDVSGGTVVQQSLRTANPENRAVALEEQFLEETEMLVALRELLVDTTPPVAFIVHCSYTEDVIIYTSSVDKAEVLSCKKVSQGGSGEPVLPAELSNFEFMMNYGPKLVPNHEREFPHVREMVLPAFVDSKDLHGHDSEGAYIERSISRSAENDIGTLVGAVQLPVTPDVIIDIWKTQSGKCWATTTVDGVSFSVVERIFMMSESKWGISQVVQVDIFGRHPSKGYLLVEHVTA